MSESEDWHAMRKRFEAFRATELGQLYWAYDLATIAYWQRDGDDSVGFKRLEKLDEACRAATNAFVAKLMELAGV